MPDSRMIHALYRKLLAIYPRGFKEQFGESMQQTFNDLCRERQMEGGWFGFVLWTFVETTVGIFREHLLLEGDAMKNMLMSVRSPALISLLLVIPFMIMEVVNRQNLNEGFPIPLFVMLWVLPLIFILTGMPIIRNLQAGNRLMAQPVNLLIRVVILVLIAVMWTALLLDQMPCFLGVPNCD